MTELLPTMKNKKKAPVYAEDWQLSVLKKLYSEITRPTEEQRLAAAAETGLDELWIRHWFTRQNAKAATRNRKKKALEGRARPADANPCVVAPFRLSVKRYVAGDQLQSTSRPHSATITPHLVKSVHGHDQSTVDGPPMTASRTASCQWSTMEASETYACERSTSGTQSRFFVDMSILRKDNAWRASYSRDPLHNRYPDFSQFFRPGVHEKFQYTKFLPTSDGLLHDGEIDAQPLQHLQDTFNHSASYGSLAGPPAFFAYPVSFTVSLSDFGLQTSRYTPWALEHR
ncbi:hypothetical protein F5I97DRAFT_1356875 [Phlebopus sp. FC_14]|nr:hypothetical protein F5I97DRAFT_1356875 [Phlebopus sp. FC_14]